MNFLTVKLYNLPPVLNIQIDFFGLQFVPNTFKLPHPHTAVKFEVPPQLKQVFELKKTTYERFAPMKGFLL